MEAERETGPTEAWLNYSLGCLQRCSHKKQSDTSENASFNCLHYGKLSLSLSLSLNAFIDLCVALERRVLYRTVAVRVASFQMTFRNVCATQISIGENCCSYVRVANIFK